MEKLIVAAVVAAILILIIVLLYKYKKEWLKVIAYYAVIQAEDLYSNGKGKEKLLFAIKQVKSALPWYVAWLISEKLIIHAIESALSNLQKQFKKAKNDKLKSLDTIISVGTQTANVVEVVKTAQEMKGYIEGYGQVKTDFKGNTNGTVGVRAGIKL